jgi:predicted nuclease of restriction endonuclease-like (RecB) superfamily
VPAKRNGLAAADHRGTPAAYKLILAEVTELLDRARRASARAVNSAMTAIYWEIGRRIVEYEQRGKQRAAYGEQLLDRLSRDLAARFGRGFSVQNLRSFRSFYLAWPIRQTVSGESEALPLAKPASVLQPVSTASLATDGGAFHPIRQTLSVESPPGTAYFRTGMPVFSLPWSHYVCLLSVENPQARKFYEAEALRGGWSVRQLDRQISSLLYERTALSRNKTAMLTKGAGPKPTDHLSAEEELKDPLILEFLGLKDEYSETDLEQALIRHLETFLLELGDDFAFVGRQRRLRIGDEWYRVDLLFFHRKLRCLVVIDLKLGKFSHADAGQMHLYLNYAREHWTREGENPPVGLILCAQKNDALARYALDNLPNKVLAAEYRLALPDEEVLAREIERTRRLIEERRKSPSGRAIK